MIGAYLSAIVWAATPSPWPERIEIFAPLTLEIRSGALAELARAQNVPLVVYRLDPTHSLQNQLSRKLARTPDRAKAQVMQIYQTDPAQFHAIAQAQIGAARAQTLGIERVPAVVFDATFIVYTDDLDAALRHYRSTHP